MPMATAGWCVPRQENKGSPRVCQHGLCLKERVARAELRFLQRKGKAQPFSQRFLNLARLVTHDNDD